MNKSLYLVGVRWVSTPITEDAIKKVDNLVGNFGDWVRLSGTLWVVETESKSQDIFRALGTVLTQQDSEIVTRIDPSDYAGFVPEWAKHWIEGKLKGHQGLPNIIDSYANTLLPYR